MDGRPSRTPLRWSLRYIYLDPWLWLAVYVGVLAWIAWREDRPTETPAPYQGLIGIALMAAKLRAAH